MIGGATLQWETSRQSRLALVNSGSRALLVHLGSQSVVSEPNAPEDPNSIALRLPLPPLRWKRPARAMECEAASK